MVTNRPEHLESFDYLGFHQYFLTFCTHQRHRAFVNAAHVDLVLSQFLRTATEQAFAVIAYCFMPDHVHLLIEGLEERSDCRAFISSAKQLSGFYYARRAGRRLWQRYGYEHTLRAEEAAISIARYIVENPVRASLVRRPEEYPFSGSSRYTMQQLLEAIQLTGWKRRAG